MISPIHAIFDDVIKTASNSHKLIADLTVYTDRLVDTSSYSVTRYYGRSRETVECYALDKLNAVDQYRSPSLSNGGKAYQNSSGYFFIELTVHGLD